MLTTPLRTMVLCTLHAETDLNSLAAHGVGRYQYDLRVPLGKLRQGVSRGLPGEGETREPSRTQYGPCGRSNRILWLECGQQVGQGCEAMVKQARKEPELLRLEVMVDRTAAINAPER